MKIYPENLSPAVPPSQETNAVPATSKRARRSAKPPAPPDQVELSPKARTLARAAHVLSETPEVRDPKVQELRRALAHGTYHVAAEQLAEKILQETLRDELS